MKKYLIVLALLISQVFSSAPSDAEIVRQHIRALSATCTKPLHDMYLDVLSWAYKSSFDQLAYASSQAFGKNDHPYFMNSASQVSKMHHLLFVDPFYYYPPKGVIFPMDRFDMVTALIKFYWALRPMDESVTNPILAEELKAMPSDVRDNMIRILDRLESVDEVLDEEEKTSK